MNPLQKFISTLPAPFNQMGNFDQMVQRAQDNLKGQDPEQYVRNAMSNGEVSQDDFNKAAKIADMIRPMFK